MAVITYPLNNLDFTAEDVGIYNSTRTTGIFAGDDFSATLTGNDNTITVGAGMAWMRLQKFFGVAVAMKTQTAVDMGLPDTNYPRIDAIILKFDANKNNTELVVKKGTASSSPQPPEVTRTEATHEIHLYQVRREPSATAITASKVTDMRLSATHCGLMTDAVSNVDTATINAQIMALIQELEDALKDVEDQTYYASKKYVDEQTEAVKSYADEQISQAAAEVNLLDNSDFQHFVAQAGVAGNHGTQAYAGDRWILDSGTVTGTWNANGNGYSGITLNGTIRQIVAEPPAGEYACAVEMVSGTATIAYANGEVTITSSGGVLKNAGLYAGSRAPKYVSKGYSAELMECQRYYVGTPMTNSYLSWAGYTHTATEARLTIPLGTMMRMKPTVTFIDPDDQRLYYNGTSTTISNVVAADLTPNGVTLVLRSTNLASGVVCTLKPNCGFSISADL